MKLQHKTALVTGGAVRIGAAIGEALAKAGCNVVIHCHHSLPAAERLCRKLKAQGVKAWVLCTELEGEADCRALIDQAWKQAGRLDILVNNAAVFHKDTVVSVTEPKLRAEFGLNLFVPVLLTRYFAERARKGSVINLLDRRIEANDTDCLPYSLSKKALAAFTLEAALALAPRIVVNGIAPGAVLPPPGKGLQYLHDRAGRIPLGARTTPSQVARAVVALLEMESVTGQIVFVDGGQHLLGNGVAL
jgi:NAD(P)-dependent dehydrogenase (short-subunit alcohol dehydrogenase family)